MYDSIRANAAEVCAEQTAQSSAELLRQIVNQHIIRLSQMKMGVSPICNFDFPQKSKSSKQVGLLRGKQVMSYSSYLCS